LTNQLNTKVHEKSNPAGVTADKALSEPSAAGYDNAMDTSEILQTIDAEIARLERARALLNGHTAPVKRGRPTSSTGITTTKPRRKMSPEARAKIAAAQKARWAKAKKG
jgi:hypothetical protein